MLVTKNYIDFKVLEPITRTVLAEWKGASKANRALPEDTVRVSPDGNLEIVATAPRKALVGVLQLTSKYMYGMTGHGVPMYLCEPMNKGYPCFRVACKEKDRSRNLLVSFQYESWEAGAELPRGSLLKILGPVEDFVAEAEALAILSSPWSSPRPESALVLQANNRTVLSEGTFNIDPAGCLDIDDVLTLVPLDGGGWRLWITIADVSETVVAGSKEYVAAQKIGATTYQDGRAVRPMFHREISEKACSLLPGEQRNGLALRVDWSPGSGFGTPVFEKVMVINQKSYTYESIYEASSALREILIGMASDLAGKRIIDSHEWIEQFMLFYNREAAAVLKSVGNGLLRIHDAPFEEKRQALLALDRKLEFLAYQSASYAPVTTTQGHWGLSMETYCHASSPLRRFADFVNQQIIKDHLDGKVRTYEPFTFETLATWLNERQKQIAAAEREYAFLQAVKAAENTNVDAIVLWKDGEKSVFYIPTWGTTVRFVSQQGKEKPGETVTIAYYCDRRKAKWKERMIYRVVEGEEQRSAL